MLTSIRSWVSSCSQRLPASWRWAVRGCLQWQESGITTPAKVMEAAADYRAEMDYFADYLDATRDRVAKLSDVMADDALSVTTLRDHYNEWAKANEHERLSQRAFAARMVGHGWAKVKDEHGWYWEMPATKVP